MAVLAGCLPTFGWGPEGHRLVAEIADAELTPAARAQVASILGPGQTLASISSWPDEIRRSRSETGPWHYVDIPIDKPHLDMARDCPKGDCLLAKIADFRKALQDPATTPAARREALMFLVHFVGDMHQPLHCSDNKDKGGNGVHVRLADRQTNLHSAWDSGLLTRLGTEQQLLPAWSPDAARHARKWSKGTVDDWAEQSHKASQKIVYGRLPKTAEGDAVTIDPAYEKRADALIRAQIERAGTRLARILNETLQ